jgi:hypothetical protein
LDNREKMNKGIMEYWNNGMMGVGLSEIGHGFTFSLHISLLRDKI